MRKILRRQRSVYALSILLCITGIIALAATLWKIYPQLSVSQNPFSAFSTLLWEESISITSAIEIKLIYLIVFGDIALVLGFILWLLSRQWLVVPGKTVRYECPYCKKTWKAVGDKALVHCPHCRQLVHPKISES